MSWQLQLIQVSIQAAAEVVKELRTANLIRHAHYLGLDAQYPEEHVEVQALKAKIAKRLEDKPPESPAAEKVHAARADPELKDSAKDSFCLTCHEPIEKRRRPSGVLKYDTWWTHA
jgi:hypothetical protein